VWVQLDKPKLIAPKLVNYMQTGSPVGRQTEEGALCSQQCQ
jgi:hypothetical protein